MSKAKDRARAKSGLIFRDGGLVNREEWYEAHPTHEMLAERQADVDKAVAETVLAAPQGKAYFCTKCLKYHRQPNSKIYQAHMAHEDQNVPTIKEA